MYKFKYINNVEIYKYNYNSIFSLQINTNGDCMFASILSQVYLGSDLYDAGMLRRQVALYMLKNPDVFHEYVCHHLMEDDGSYESYYHNIFRGDSWGEQLCVAAVVRMWNV